MRAEAVLANSTPGRFAEGAVASIPSPSTNVIEIGPLNLNIYGLCIALGVIAAVWLMGKRLERAGLGTQDDAAGLAMWGVLAGVIGARLYHVVTDFDKFDGNLAEIPQLWKGGLGIPGGLLLGIPAGLWAARKRNLPLGLVANCAAPAIALAQAIGRWGNYFNQELYGRPTDLPWALEIAPENAPGFAAGTTFHPTFLYESLWNLALCIVLLRIDAKFRIRPWQLMAMYVAGYGVGRLWVEGLRSDSASELAGLRWNQWVALAAIVGGGAIALLLRRRPAAGLSGDDIVSPGTESARADAAPAADADVDADVDVDADRLGAAKVNRSDEGGDPDADAGAGDASSSAGDVGGGDDGGGGAD